MQRLWVGLGLVACGVLLYLCLMPHPPSVGIHNADKLEHFLAFGILGTWFAGVLAPRYLAVFIGLVGFGAAIEVIQGLVGRDADLFDLAADTLGVLAGIGAARLGALDWLRYIDARVAANRNSAG
ncbi:VanZ family protein [Salinisphaera sp. T31B1]|uniref:VanZ family protein n=1 Tax=Salinisphaera sp. T31B1 TaxID=727963 RepID=UPI003341C85C